MKLTQVLGKQHLERMAKRHWFIQGKKKVIQTKAEQHVTARGYQVLDAVETFVTPQKPVIDFDLAAVSDKPLPRNRSHPDYKADPCFKYGDGSALLGGLRQAQVLTNTTLASQPLPNTLIERENATKIPAAAHEQMKKKVLLACAFDAEQKKLPKRKDPLRPAWNFPRDFGITDVRKNELLCTHLVRMCELLQRSRDMSFVDSVSFSLPLNAHGKQMQLELSAEILATSEHRLAPPVTTPEQISDPLPDLYPMHPTVSLEPDNFYKLQDFYPGSMESKWKHAHTALLHFNGTQVKNLYDSPVTPDQAEGRLLLKAFCIAASEARALQQGNLKSPVTVQAMQTDGQMFSFAVYQLNTLDVEGRDGARNICWIAPPLSLYSACGYVSGRPVIEDYNPLVLQRVLAFLANR